LNLFFLLSVIIFVGTLLLVILRPKNIGIGYSALIGAAISFIFGIINFQDIVTVWDIIWNATFTFVAIIIISLILDEAGVFEFAAIKVAKFSGGNGKVLLILVILLGAGISAVFANDGTALILTPIIYLLLRRANVEQKRIIPFIMATGFIADSSSLPLIISNLVNIITAGYFGISFMEYAFKMLLPDVVSILASVVFLYLFYRKEIPGFFDMSKMRDEHTVIRDPFIFRISLPMIIILLLAYSLGGYFSLPVSIIAVPASVLLLLIARINRKVDLAKPLKEAPWQIVLFSLGMYLVVFGMGREGMTQILSGVLNSMNTLYPPLRVLFSGYLFAAIAGIMNNLPSIMLGNLALSSVHGPLNLVYANVVGNDIGPKFTPIGSLATLVWIHTLNRKSGIRISTGYYMKVGFIIGFPVLTLTLLSLSI
jgi:arsenical pump membrane protein